MDVSSYAGVDGGTENSWVVNRLLPNTQTCLKAGVAQQVKCDADLACDTLCW